MSGINKVIIVGHLGQDPALKKLENDNSVCRLNIATTRVYTNQSTNEKVEETEWHRVTVWGKQAQNCEKFLKKGSQVYVEGRLKTSTYTDENDVKKYSTEIVAETVQFLGGKSSAKQDENGPKSPDDDIPF